MQCSGEGYSWDQDNSCPKNSEIVEAFSPSDELKLHCVINTADRELFVMASSCRNAKILAVYHGHLQGIGCGRCSRKDMERYTPRASQDFWNEIQAISQSREPKVVWSAGYFSEGRDRILRSQVI